MSDRNIHIVNKTGQDLRMFDPVLKEAYRTGKLPEDYADIFSIDFLDGLNPDGSKRMLVGMAED